MVKLKQNPLALGLFLAIAGGFAWAKRRLARARAARRASGKHHRYIDPQSYTANNPQWLKGAITAPPSDQELPPPLLAFLERFQNSQGQLLPQFGAAAREQLFALDPDVAYLNHGSYGATFRLALEVQGWYQQLLEAEPVHFMEHVAVPGMLHALASVASFINADARDVVAVPNATTAVCTVLNCIPLAPGDVVCMFNTTYPAVRSALARKALASRAQLLEVQWTLEELAHPELVIQATRQALRAVPRGRLKLVVLDYVISFPPAILPVAKLAQICRQAGAQVLVDAAHGVGAIPGLDVPAMGADYVTSNLHKWCCTPKGTAFLWVAPARQHALVPLVTSHGCGLGMQGEFIWKGTTDQSAWLAVPAALHVIQALGEHRIAEHNHRLVAAAAQQLLDWSNAALSASPPAATGTAAVAAAATAVAAGPRMLGGDGIVSNAGMLAVALPPLRGYHPASSTAATQLHEALFSQHRIEIPVAFIAGQLWVRLSAQIYNTWQDYQRLIAALQPLLIHTKPGETGTAA